MKTIFELIRDMDDKIVARNVGRSVVSSLNFNISTVLAQYMRMQKFGMPVPEEGNSVDNRNEQDADTEGNELEKQVRNAQGFATPEEATAVASRLIVIRDSVNSWLYDNAGQIALASDPTKTMPDQWHVGEGFEASLVRRVARTPLVSEARVKQEAEFLGISEDDVRAAALNNASRQVVNLATQKDDIVAMYKDLQVKGASVVDLDQAEETFEELPALTQYRIISSVDRELFRTRQNEVGFHMNGRAESGGNIALLDEARRNVLGYAAFRMKEEAFSRQLEGASLPNFGPKLPEKKTAAQA